MTGATTPLLDVQDLHVMFRGPAGWSAAVSGLDLRVQAGQTVALVGESGCGKSTTALALLRLLDPGSRVQGRILFDGADIAALPDADFRRLRGGQISMIFQEPMTSLNPVHTIGKQIAEAIRCHEDVSGAELRRRSLELLERVRIPDAAARIDDYPHQLSGGQRQRVMIAMAIACRPRLLIADEPTTALDVTVQAQILALLDELRGELGMGLLLITHDLGVVRQWADRVIVMHGGTKLEENSTERLFAAPAHDYTRGLLGASLHARGDIHYTTQRLPEIQVEQSQAGKEKKFVLRTSAVRGVGEQPAKGVGGTIRDGVDDAARDGISGTVRQGGSDAARDGISDAAWDGIGGTVRQGGSDAAWDGIGDAVRQGGGQPLLSVRAVSTHYPGRHGTAVHAVEDVSFDIAAGETLGLVGESGCGKSTLSRTLVRLTPAHAGQALLRGADLLAVSERELKPLRRHVQMVFQDPYASLNPRHTVHDILSAVLRTNGASGRAERDQRIKAILDNVGLPRDAARRYPNEFSGGQRQRIGIARALVTRPSLVILDEPVSALDVSVQAQILNLLVDLKHEFGLSYLFISHDLAVVRYLCDRVMVMRQGRIVEQGTPQAIWQRAEHPYTRSLLEAIAA